MGASVLPQALPHALPQALPVTLSRVSAGRVDRERAQDWVTAEEPLEIRVAYGMRGSRQRLSLSVTMRTPGSDAELAAGFLFSEGLIDSDDEIEGIVPCGRDGHAVRVELVPGERPGLEAFQRSFATHSGCGVCGKKTLDSLWGIIPKVAGGEAGPRIQASVLHGLEEKVRRGQSGFATTGGLHACALFGEDGALVSLREDVGRHNALDKLVGRALLAGELPLAQHICWLSGRASFELVQKAGRAGIRIVAAVGAPSSLAVELAQQFEMTLVGFLRSERFNIYCGDERVL